MYDLNEFEDIEVRLNGRTFYVSADVYYDVYSAFADDPDLLDYEVSDVVILAVSDSDGEEPQCSDEDYKSLEDFVKSYGEENYEVSRLEEF